MLADVYACLSVIWRFLAETADMITLDICAISHTQYVT